MTPAALTESVDVLVAWFDGADRVSTEVCPAVMAVGLKAKVTPLGTPLTLSVASPLKPDELLSATA